VPVLYQCTNMQCNLCGRRELEQQANHPSDIQANTKFLVQACLSIMLYHVHTSTVVQANFSHGNHYLEPKQDNTYSFHQRRSSIYLIGVPPINYYI